MVAGLHHPRRGGGGGPVTAPAQERRRVLSLGAGVQSSTLYLMAVAGEFGTERPEVAVFADTQWEPRSVYTWLDRLEEIGGAIVPIKRVTAGSVRDSVLYP